MIYPTVGARAGIIGRCPLCGALAAFGHSQMVGLLAVCRGGHTWLVSEPYDGGRFQSMTLTEAPDRELRGW